MEIIIFSIFVILMFILALFDKQYAFLGVIAGIGLVMVAFSIPISGLDMNIGSVSVFNATTNTTYLSNSYTSIATMYSVSWLDTLISLVIGGAGVIFIITSALKNGGKF